MNEGQSIEVVLEQESFFAPSTTGWLEGIVAQYNKQKKGIEHVSEFMLSQEVQGIMPNFYEIMRRESQTYICNEKEIFQAEKAITALNSRYWQKALALTDVMDFMPKKRRDEWNTQIRELTTPAFEEETVKATIAKLLTQRVDFLAEMVDGIFTGLSSEHITNRPEGFWKRMIIDNVYNLYYEDHKSGLIHDMRCVIAKFRGTENPGCGSTRHLLDRIKLHTGVWHMVDNGAFRIRVYKKGTAHMEINPDIAYRLNQILAYLHPMAIPAPHRKKPNKKQNKTFTMVQNPIPVAVINMLNERRWLDKRNLEMGINWYSQDKHMKKKISQVMKSIGGVLEGSIYRFDYDAKQVVYEMLTSGVIPDEKSHQFYPTPSKIAKIAIEMADIQNDDTILEPSAGQGDLAKYIQPTAMVTCVEISPLNCKILKSKGFQVENIDFTKWNGGKFDKIVMNPPFSEGRWIMHTQKAAEHLNPGGTIVAVLPTTAMNKPIFDDTMKVSFSNIFSNEFSGTSIEVVIMKAEKKRKGV